MSGRRNCARCGAWRQAADFGAAESCGEMAGWCGPCRRGVPSLAEARSGRRRQEARLSRMVERGSHVWAAPVGEWIRERVGRGEATFVQLALWAETDEKQIRRIARGQVRVVGVAQVDRMLVAEGSTHLSELCPLDEAA